MLKVCLMGVVSLVLKLLMVVGLLVIISLEIIKLFLMVFNWLMDL